MLTLMGSLMEPGLDSLRESRLREMGDTMESVGLLYDCLHQQGIPVSQVQVSGWGLGCQTSAHSRSR